jgi:hypothetical protein
MNEVQRLSRWERVAVTLVLTAFVLFGLLVEKRSAFMQRRMGDLGVYLRAGWTIRMGGAQLYDLCDDNGWHYNYPPLFAILMAPLADPPPGEDAAGMVPYEASVAICYVLNVLFLALGIHVLARAMERTSRHAQVRGQPAGCRRWWYLRVIPLLVCLPPIGHTLMRGQANLLLLAMICATIAALLNGRQVRAGLWLAGAICLKIFPAYLLLVPLLRRDLRCLAGCGLGLVLGLVVIPVAVLGPNQTVQSYKELAQGMVGPALNLNEDQSRAKELIEVTATDSQSYLAVLHNTLHLERTTRPDVASPEVRALHWALGGLFTLLTLAAGWRRQAPPGPAVTTFVGALTVIMIMLSPVCHTHYFALALPLVMGLTALAWEQNLAGWRLALLVSLMILQIVGHTLPLLPIFEILKDAGLAMYMTMALWLAACLMLARRTSGPSMARPEMGWPRAA